MALISDGRLFCQSWIYFAGAHQHVKGWHTVYKNKPFETNHHLQHLHDAGLHGQIAIVLCGPFTTDQRALVMKWSVIRPKKVKAALQWLKIHNIFFQNVQIPEVIPEPIIVDNSK